MTDYAKPDRSAARLARFYLGELDEVRFLEELRVESRWSWNDAAFNVAEKFRAEGGPHEAARWYRRCLELSVGEDHPAGLARRRLSLVESSTTTLDSATKDTE